MTGPDLEPLVEMYRDRMMEGLRQGLTIAEVAGSDRILLAMATPPASPLHEVMSKAITVAATEAARQHEAAAATQPMARKPCDGRRASHDHRSEGDRQDRGFASTRPQHRSPSR
jgi:hypothetical protein